MEDAGSGLGSERAAEALKHSGEVLWGSEGGGSEGGGRGGGRFMG